MGLFNKIKTKKKSKRVKILDIKVYIDSDKVITGDVDFNNHIIDNERLNLNSLGSFVKSVLKTEYKY